MPQYGYIDLMLGSLLAIAFFALGRMTANTRTCKGRFAYKVGRPQPKGSVPMLELACTNEQKFQGTITPITGTGKPSAVQAGSLVVEVADGEGTAVVTGDNTFELISQDVVDETPVTSFKVSADADLGEGVETITEFVTLTVTGAKAASLGVSFGGAVPK